MKSIHIYHNNLGRATNLARSLVCRLGKVRHRQREKHLRTCINGYDIKILRILVYISWIPGFRSLCVILKLLLSGIILLKLNYLRVIGRRTLCGTDHAAVHV
jgi:hypothetical protein